VAGAPLLAQESRPGIPAEDARNAILQSRTHYKMPVFATREAWLERAAFLRKQILASAGLLPMPEKRPLNAQIFGRLERDGYSVEKVLPRPTGLLSGRQSRRPRKTGPSRHRFPTGTGMASRKQRAGVGAGEVINPRGRDSWCSVRHDRAERHEPDSHHWGDARQI
jgi:hypothetical protein